MPDVPSSTLYRWATSLANRVAPTSGAKAAGFLDGKPVPPGDTNDILGMLSDWVSWLKSSQVGTVSGDLLFLEAVSAPWYPLSTDSGTTILILADNDVIIAEDGGDNKARAQWSHLVASGTISSVTVSIPQQTTTTGTASLTVVISSTSIYDPAFPAAAIYTADIPAGPTPGAVALTLSTGTPPTHGPLGLTCLVTTGTGTNDVVKIASITVEFA